MFYLLAAMLSFGVGWYYYQEVAKQTATISKLRLVAEDGLVIRAGTTVDDEFIDTYVVKQRMPRALAGEFTWAMSDDPVTLINLKGKVFGQDVPAGSFLQSAHFFASGNSDFARRIQPGYRAFSIPIEDDRAVSNFIKPGAHVDVIGAFVAADESIVTRRMLENAEVMAVGEFDSTGSMEGQEDNISYSNVTLQAPAAVVESFLAQEVLSINDLTLVLRNPCEDASDCVGLGQ